MLRYFFIFLSLGLLATPFNLGAQISISGKVFDLSTSDPIDFCNVFVVGTTLGAGTDSLGNFAFEVPAPGKYELVFSHVAYKPEIVDIEVDDQGLKLDPTPLTPDTRYVDEVIVTGKKDRRWQRQYDRFINYAMGKHFREKRVEVMNPYVVEFKAAGKGMLTEAQPFTLKMRNDFTGYEVSFLVQRAFLSKSNQFMVGYPGFTPLTSPDLNKMAEWTANRKKSYRGSLRHIFYSILKNQMETEGFDAQITEKNPAKFQGAASKILPITLDKTINLNKDNLLEYVKITDTDDPRIQKIVFKELLKVTYRNEQDSYGNPQQTLIEALDGEILVYLNGVPVNPTSMKLYGYLASEGLYEMLPFDYELSK